MSGMVPAQLFAQIVADNFAVPADSTAVELVPELLGALGHPDPVVRDEQAYAIPATWLAEGHLDASLVSIGDACAQALAHPDILRRSFSTLILTECLQRGRPTGLVSRAQAEGWMRAWAAWHPHETDVRSWEEGIGWIHAVAHGADTAGAYALWLEDGDELLALAAVLEARLRSLEVYPNQAEDDRLALSFLGILSRPAFGPDELRLWSERYRTLWADSSAGAAAPGAILALRTLHSLDTLLYVGATIGGESPAPFAPALIHAICRVANRLPALRMTEQGGEAGYWQEVWPAYTVFHPATETFSVLWTEYHPDFEVFLARYQADVAHYGEQTAFFPKGQPPAHGLQLELWTRLPVARLYSGALQRERGPGAVAAGDAGQPCSVRRVACGAVFRGVGEGDRR